MRYLSWIITVPIALVAISFAVSNRDPVTLWLWPLPFRMEVAPGFLVVLVPLVLGFILGGLVAGINGWRWRRLARRREARLTALGEEIRQHRDRERQAAEAAAREAEAARLQAAAAAAGTAAQQDRPRLEARSS